MKPSNVLTGISGGIVLLVLMLYLQSCGGGGENPAQTPKDKAAALLTAPTWKLQSVAADGVDQSTLFKNWSYAKVVN